MQSLYETDITKIEKFVRLEKKPVSVRWQTFEKGASGSSQLGPTDWELIAILEYDQATIQAIHDQMAATQLHGELQVAPLFLRDWFPEAVRSSFIKAPDSSNLVLNTLRYEPGLFAKPPLQFGYAFISDTWVFLYLHTM